MDPSVIRLIAHFRLGLGVRPWIDDGIRIDGFSRRNNIKQIGRRGQRLFDDYGRFWVGHGRTCKRRRFGACHQNGLRLLAPRRRLSLLIFVVRVAGGAACLLHLVFNHRDDRMIRDAALARTVVVQNVTEPNPALLH